MTRSNIEKLQFTQHVELKVEADSERAFEEWETEYILPLLRLMTLVTGAPNKIDKLYFTSHKYTETVFDEARKINVSVVCNSDYLKPKQRDGCKLLLAFRHIEKNLSAFMECWWRIADELDSVCNLFFAVQDNDDLKIDQRFLFCAQAVETYHRRRKKNEILPKDEYKRRIKEIVTTVPVELQTWLKEKLQHGNEPTLVERISDLLQTEEDGYSFQQLIEPIVGNIEAFVKKVRDHRNYYTHWDVRFKHRTVSYSELFDITQTLEFLLRACFLKELGLPLWQCILLVKRTQEYGFALRRGKGMNSPVTYHTRVIYFKFRRLLSLDEQNNRYSLIATYFTVVYGNNASSSQFCKDGLFAVLVITMTTQNASDEEAATQAIEYLKSLFYIDKRTVRVSLLPNIHAV